MTRDQVWVPKTRSQRGIPTEDELAARRADAASSPSEPSLAEKLDDLFEDAPLYNVLNIVLQQLVGWPAYLITNATGPFGYPKWTTHFDPESALFDKRNRRDILVSDLGLAIAFGVLGTWAYYRGVTEVARLYVAPWLWVNHWLVLITYLQHTDPKMPHYRDPEWNFQRGALCTIDRHCFGFFMHGIAETHVVHHLCSKMCVGGRPGLDVRRC
jgi:omega-6 fatty acid desaturase (delta-12 desaturase)